MYGCKGSGLDAFLSNYTFLPAPAIRFFLLLHLLVTSVVVGLVVVAMVVVTGSGGSISTSIIINTHACMLPQLIYN